MREVTSDMLWPGHVKLVGDFYFISKEGKSWWVTNLKDDDDVVGDRYGLIMHFDVSEFSIFSSRSVER